MNSLRSMLQRIQRWTPILFVLLAAVFTNWVYPYVDLFAEKPQPSFVDSEIPDLQLRYHAGGWPWKYIAIVEYDRAPPMKYWDYNRLTGNIVVWVVLLGLAVGYSFFNSRQTNFYFDAQHQLRRKGLFAFGLLDAFVAMVLIGFLVVYGLLTRLEYQNSQLFVNEIRQSGGSVATYASVPLPLTILPQQYLEPLRRISMVAWDNPTRKGVRYLVKNPHLRSLRIGGDDYDLDVLQELAALPRLTDLRIAGRTLDDKTIRLIGSLKGLQALSLIRTNVTAKGLASFGEMPRLRYLNAIHTDIKLSEIQSSHPWTRSVSHLFLPRPTKDHADSLTIDQWPELEQLHIFEYDERLNPQPVSITLSNTPKLHQVSLDILQIYDLNLSNLPRLAQLETREIGVRERIKNNELVPNGVWLRNVSLSRLPELNQLKLYGCNLESIAFDECGKLNLNTSFTACDHSIAEDRPARTTKPSYVSLTNRKTKLSNNNTAKILQAIGNSRGLTTINLDGLDLEGADLSPLSQITGASELNLSNTGIDIDQLEPLKSLDNLTTLFLIGTRVTGRDLKKILDWFPHLQSINLDPQTMGRIRLEQHPRLQSLSKGSLFSSDALRLVDLPQFNDTLCLPPQLGYLHLQNLPSLEGVYSTGAWPAQAFLSGVNAIKYFAAGGENFNDSSLEQLMNCELLRSLTIAYSKVTPTKLKELNRFKNLHSLVLSGSIVSDATISSWDEIKDLELLYLDETKITSKSLTWISSLKHLQYLSLDYEVINHANLETFAALKNLKALTIRGGKISPAFLSNLKDLTELKEICFTDSTLSRDALSSFANVPPPNLVAVDLRTSHFDSKDLNAFLQISPMSLKVACSSAHIEPAIYSNLLQSERILDEERLVFIQEAGKNFHPSHPRNALAPESSNRLDLFEGDGLALKPQIFKTGLQSRSSK